MPSIKYVLYKIIKSYGIEVQEVLAYNVDTVEAAQAKLDDLMVIQPRNMEIDYRLITIDEAAALVRR
jgi:hypothetical protein